jgi:hypothetical protein
METPERARGSRQLFDCTAWTISCAEKWRRGVGRQSPTKAGGNCEHSQGFAVLGWVQTGTYPLLYPNPSIAVPVLYELTHVEDYRTPKCSIARSCVENILEYITEAANASSAALLSHNFGIGIWVRTHTFLGQNPHRLGSKPTFFGLEPTPKRIGTFEERRRSCRVGLVVAGGRNHLLITRRLSTPRSSLHDSRTVGL